jgi:hypothetical protein
METERETGKKKADGWVACSCVLILQCARHLYTKCIVVMSSFQSLDGGNKPEYAEIAKAANVNAFSVCC